MRRANSEGTLNSYVVRGDEIQLGDRFGYKVVAVINRDGSMSVYRGLTDWSDEKTALEGDSVSEEVAKSLFPVIYSETMRKGYFYVR